MDVEDIAILVSFFVLALVLTFFLRSFKSKGEEIKKEDGDDLYEKYKERQG
jgi:hypothetical protein